MVVDDNGVYIAVMVSHTQHQALESKNGKVVTTVLAGEHRHSLEVCEVRAIVNYAACWFQSL